MANKPLILGDNLFDNVVLHPGFTVQNFGADDVAGREAFRIADNLRDMTSWTRTTTNAQSFLDVDCLAAVSPNTIILDRGHNLAGKTVLIAGYDDLAHTNLQQQSPNCVIPSTPGGLPSDPNGCLTPDGVWWKTYTPAGPKRVQSLVVNAMGIGLAPIVTGAYLGVSYRFPEYLNAPGSYDYDTQVKYMRNELSRGGVRVKSRPINFGMLSLSIDMDGVDYPAFDAAIRPMLRYNAPMWVAYDDADATGIGQARLFQLSGDFRYAPPVNPFHRQGVKLELEEVIPTLFA